MTFKSLGKITKIDYETDEVTIKYGFLTPEQRSILEDYANENKIVKHTFNHRFKRNKTYPQQKAWYKSIALILRAKEIVPTSEAMYIEDEEQRKAIFPVVTIQHGDLEIVRPLRMKECNFDQMQNNIEVLQERHKHLLVDGEPIDFDK